MPLPPPRPPPLRRHGSSRGPAPHSVRPRDARKLIAVDQTGPRAAFRRTARRSPRRCGTGRPGITTPMTSAVRARTQDGVHVPVPASDGRQSQLSEDRMSPSCRRWRPFRVWGRTASRFAPEPPSRLRPSSSFVVALAAAVAVGGRPHRGAAATSSGGLHPFAARASWASEMATTAGDAPALSVAEQWNGAECSCLSPTGNPARSWARNRLPRPTGHGNPDLCGPSEGVPSRRSVQLPDCPGPRRSRCRPARRPR